VPIAKARSTDAMSSALVAGTRSTENAAAIGQFSFECVGADGKIKWTGSAPNLVVNVGLAYMAGSALTGVGQVTAWYIGLYGAGASNTPAASNTMISHPGWTEIVPYSNNTRLVCNFVTATTANPSVATNAASPAGFLISTAATVGGAFLVSSSIKSGTAGILFSAADFSAPGDRIVAFGDTLNVTYAMSLSVGVA
jgi:hypothetical protein